MKIPPAFRRHCKLLIIALVVSSISGASPIPSSRLPKTPWAPGLPGGIPDTSSWTVINVKTAYGATGNGSTDDTAAIQNALTAAVASAANRVVYLPAGTYRLNGNLSLDGLNFYDNVSRPFSVVVKGDGPTKTFLKSYTSSGTVLSFNAWAADARTTTISSGNTPGSTKIVVSGSSLPAFFPPDGQQLVISRTNSVAGVTAPSYMINTRSQIVKVVSHSGQTITISPALNDGFSGDYLTMGISPPYHCGAEGVSIERMVNGGGHNLMFAFANECWVRNIESKNASGWHLRIVESFHCEFRGNYIHDGWNGGGDSIYGVGLFQFSCDNLVEDNIFYHTRHAMITEYGGQNNVFGYNYSKDTINENQLKTDWIMGDMISHGGNPQYTLWEGNVGQRLSWDNELGGSEYLTAFRNHIQRVGILGAANPNPLRAVEQMRNNYHGNVVGNVLLTPGQVISNYTWNSTTNTNLGSIRRFGYNTDGDGNQAGVDPTSAATAFFHMNWDYFYGSSDPSYNDPSAVDNNLPSSYYRSSQPSWWDSGAWPAIGPDLTNKAGENPAYRRYQSYLAGGLSNPSLLFSTAVVTAPPPVLAPSNATTSIKVGP